MIYLMKMRSRIYFTGAEGAARNSNKEFIQFLYVSLGSLSELETQLLLSKEIGLIENSAFEENIEHIRKMLLGLIKYLKKKIDC